MFVVNYLLKMSTDFVVIIYRFENDIFDKSLASFHIKEQLILHILTKLSKFIDKYSLFLNKRDPSYP